MLRVPLDFCTPENVSVYIDGASFKLTVREDAMGQMWHDTRIPSSISSNSVSFESEDFIYEDNFEANAEFMTICSDDSIH